MLASPLPTVASSFLKYKNNHCASLWCAFSMKIIWDNSESNAPLEMDEVEEVKEATAAFFKKLREELEAEDLEEDYEEEEA